MQRSKFVKALSILDLSELLCFFSDRPVRQSPHLNHKNSLATCSNLGPNAIHVCFGQRLYSRADVPNDKFASILGKLVFKVVLLLGTII